MERRRGDGRSVTLVVSHDETFVARVADRIIDLTPPDAGRPLPRAVPAPVAEPPPVAAEALAVRGLRVAHGPALLDVEDLSLRRGELVAVTGPSGSGKSTLLRALAGLHVPACGDLGVLGRRPPGPWTDATATRSARSSSSAKTLRAPSTPPTVSRPSSPVRSACWPGRPRSGTGTRP